MREATAWPCLYARYPDQVILYFTTAGGWMTVQAAGEDDVHAVLDGLTPEAKCRATMDLIDDCRV